MTSIDLAIILGLLALWYTLNRWVLPWFGIQTCMSGCCGVDSCRPAAEEPPKEAEPQGDSQ